MGSCTFSVIHLQWTLDLKSLVTQSSSYSHFFRSPCIIIDYQPDIFLYFPSNSKRKSKKYIYLTRHLWKKLQTIWSLFCRFFKLYWGSEGKFCRLKFLTLWLELDLKNSYFKYKPKNNSDSSVTFLSAKLIFPQQNY